jgi:hypothetical protein
MPEEIDQIDEEEEEEIFLKEHPEERIFKEVLGEALQYRTYEQPP